MKIKKMDIAICLVLSVVLLIFVFELGNIKPMARSYPLFVLIGSYAMIALVLYQSLRPSKKVKAEEGEAPLEVPAILRVIVYCAAILAYILLMDKLGYILSTILFAVFSLLYQKNKNIAVVVVLPLVMALLMYFVFSKFLYVFLPTGTWIDRFF